MSKDANVIAYAPTNTLILTDTAANIRRLMRIIDQIDIETYGGKLVARGVSVITAIENVLPRAAVQHVRAKVALEQVVATATVEQSPTAADRSRSRENTRSSLARLRATRSGEAGYPPNQLGIGMSAMVRSPGVTRRIFGMLFTVIDAVAMSPCTPPSIFDEIRGDPSMSTESYDSGAPR